MRVRRASRRPRMQPILLQADEIVYDSDGQTVSAVGHVEIVDEGRILHGRPGDL